MDGPQLLLCLSDNHFLLSELLLSDNSQNIRVAVDIVVTASQSNMSSHAGKETARADVQVGVDFGTTFTGS